MKRPNDKPLPWQYEYDDTPEDKLKFEMRLTRHLIRIGMKGE